MVVPSLYEWAGGRVAIERLFVRFYERVPAEPLLRDVFARMDPAHALRRVGLAVGGAQLAARSIRRRQRGDATLGLGRAQGSVSTRVMSFALIGAAYVRGFELPDRLEDATPT
jgi:hemoglobin